MAIVFVTYYFEYLKIKKLYLIRTQLGRKVGLGECKVGLGE